MRKVDLNEIPYEIKNKKKNYLWKQSIGMKIPFIYGEPFVLSILQ